ncbi:hypothetical protein VM1G_01360 [Cytospora mali]|uniref:Xylanolytic transcriptional activator regulatory domain-containing protein n=1 Tax=Cytospora mali TaxID=578113 RepID=A0A194VP91_CYTMA|nr:hypothetical protein VM1G_01360 [Valsa mali]
MANGLVLDDSVQSTLAYLIFALGEVAVDAYNDPSQRLSRGNAAQPPGLVYFNEARRRMGFNLTECSLENVQIFALAGVYYETCFHHVGFWRMTTSASLACQALLLSHPEELTSTRGDIIRRAFWHCYIIETSFSPELGMPITGLDKYEALVRVPDFGGVLSQEDYVSNQASHYQEHFASQIVLRRLSADFHTVLNSVSSAPAMPGAIKPLAMQLDQWRETLLPIHLRWREDDPGSLPNNDHNVYDTLAYQAVPDIGAGPHPIPTAAGLSMFTADLDTQPVAYPYATDIQVALLRTRYYITKHMIYRPFLYKALHHADQMTKEDAEGVAHCLRACIKWPLTMSPACTRKRLIPCIFFWTQNLLGVLIILHLSEQVPILLRIRTSGICGERFDMEASETIRLAIQWIRDLKDADSASEWAWGVVKAIYKLDE